MAVTYLLLGGNLGNRLYNIEASHQGISQQLGTIIQKSAIYETEPWGFVHSQLFLNQVVAVETQLLPRQLLQKTQAIEYKLGRRNKGSGYTGRTMDIDILFYDEAIVRLPGLRIPHPRLHLRRFTLEPLVELVPEMTHPYLQQNMRELLYWCPDELGVYPMAVAMPGV